MDLQTLYTVLTIQATAIAILALCSIIDARAKRKLTERIKRLETFTDIHLRLFQVYRDLNDIDVEMELNKAVAEIEKHGGFTDSEYVDNAMKEHWNEFKKNLNDKTV